MAVVTDATVKTKQWMAACDWNCQEGEKIKIFSLAATENIAFTISFSFFFFLRNCPLNDEKYFGQNLY